MSYGVTLFRPATVCMPLSASSSVPLGRNSAAVTSWVIPTSDALKAMFHHTAPS
jgi:hypothetical protein